MVHLDQVNNLAQWIASREAEESVLPWESLGSREWPLLTGAEASLMDKLQALPLKLGGVSEKIFQGVATSADSIFILELLEAGSGTSRVRSKALGTELSIESELLHPVLKGAEIRRYETPEPSLVILFPYSVHEERAYPITASEIERRYPLAFEYLSKNKTALLERSKTDSSNWWLYPYPKNLALYGRPKILSQVLSRHGSFSLDDQGNIISLAAELQGGTQFSFRATTVRLHWHSLRF